MIVEYKINDSITLKMDAADPTDIFKKIGSVTEAFGDKCCGACGGTSIAYRCRTAQTQKGTFEFLECACENPDCRAVLGIGKTQKDGTLFRKRKDRDGNYLPCNGWTVWSGSKNSGDARAEPPVAKMDDVPW